MKYYFCVCEQSFSRKSQDSACWPGVYRLCMSLMESLLKTLRYNFINEALDFVGVHQERILQVPLWCCKGCLVMREPCRYNFFNSSWPMWSFIWSLWSWNSFSPPPQCLNAVRTVQSLACLDEADHTVGFLLQLSSFCKEWQFHLPNLLRDVQASPEESCTPAAITPQLHWCSHLFSISPFVSSLQVNLCYLCQTCTYLLHSKKMLHHYLQVSYSYGCIATKISADTRKKWLMPPLTI